MTPSAPESRTVLMCGGPADGRWQVVEYGQREVTVMETGLVRVMGVLEPIGPALPQVRYRIMPMDVLGHRMWVGVAVDDAYDDRAILRALLQRDVAQHLGVYR